MSEQLQVLRGTLDMLVLSTLATRPMHGYGIVQAIRDASREALIVEEGSLYPALHRMEKRGWIRGEWKRLDTGHRARVYRLTPEGEEQLRSERDTWARYTRAAGYVLGQPGLAVP